MKLEALPNSILRTYRNFSMKASDKEIKCITVSQKFHDIAANRALQKLKDKHIPVILTPRTFIRRFIPDFKKIWSDNPPLKKVLFFILVVIFYIILLPFAFIYGLYEFAFGKRQATKRQISDLKTFAKLDFNVSSDKLFVQLWNDKGLVDKGSDFYALSFTTEEKAKCIEEWFKILYDDPRQLDHMKKVIRDRQVQGARKFHEENPGGHINLRKVEDILPDEIDYLMPNYE